MKIICKKEVYEIGNAICYIGKEYIYYYYFSNDNSYISIHTEIGCITFRNKQFKEHFCTLDELRELKIKKIICS